MHYLTISLALCQLGDPGLGAIPPALHRYRVRGAAIQFIVPPPFDSKLHSAFLFYADVRNSVLDTGYNGMTAQGNSMDLGMSNFIITANFQAKGGTVMGYQHPLFDIDNIHARVYVFGLRNTVPL